MRIWWRSVRFALQGLAFAWRNERNMRIHLCLALAALLLVALLDVPLVQALFVLLSILLVLTGELFNTALEKTIDATGAKPHPLAKAAKDCAAAAVLLCALFAVVVGIAVFGPLILEGPAWRWK
ncbi:MAG: hypothetical protein BAA04_05980 [Firmicutes bacterium ZCTH02-B6]|nr:MAG: hypothetical protein BAA04_05980 [Firmicutes bacterium ZCTH02-B6]